jgi:hypothetical protein
MGAVSDKALAKRARRHVSERLRDYYNSMKVVLEQDAERFFEQVMQQARAAEERQSERRPAD